MATLAVVLSWLSSCLLSETYAPYRGLFTIVFFILFVMTPQELLQKIYDADAHGFDLMMEWGNESLALIIHRRMVGLLDEFESLEYACEGVLTEDEAQSLFEYLDPQFPCDLPQ
jgi:hypothetical protein